MDGDFEVVPALLGFLAALLSTLGLTPLARWSASSLGILDRPDGKRKLQKRAIPLLGGVAVYAGILLGMGALCLLHPLGSIQTRLPFLGLSMGLLCILGVCDDHFDIPARWKFSAQVFAALPIIQAGWIMERISFFGYGFELGAFSIPLTVIWLVAGINAVNFIDGMDGLASTTGLCVSLGVAAVGWVLGNTDCILFAAVLAGATAGFLAYNLPPAVIYLGDAGSMVIGLMLAWLTMLSTEDSLGRMHITVMVILMAIPIGDTALAILRRSLNGRGIWHPDRGHIHHRLLDRGFSVGQALCVVTGIYLCTAGLAVLTRVIGWEIIGWIASGALAAVLIRARLVGDYEWSLTKGFVEERLRHRLTVPSSQELAALSFDAAWERLVSLLAGMSVRRLQLQLGQPNRSPVRKEWLRSQMTDAPNDDAALEIRYRTSDAWCILRIETDQLGQQPMRWNAVSRLLRQFAQHWTMNSNPATELRLHDEDHLVVPRMVTAGEQTIRAA